MRITTKGRYAIRAITHMALRGEKTPISIKKISEEENLSPIFLEQIFTKLKKSGITSSIRGASGGFILARDLDKISVNDILVSVEEGVELTPCTPKKNDTCQHLEGCILNNFWNDTEKHIEEYLDQQTIQSIIDQYSK